jgi:Fic family protein
MRGQRIDLIWQSNPALYAPARYRRACRYEAYVPFPIADLPLTLDARTAGVVSDAENAIRELNTASQPALAPLARLLLRTESIASSKVEGIQLGARDLARAEARAEVGGRAGPTALELLANIDAMQLAVDAAAAAERFTLDDITTIHRRLMAGASDASVGCRIREEQNWIGGNDYNPCGADFVPPPPDYLGGLLSDLCEAMNDESLPPLIQAALVHAQFETIHPFADGNGRTGRALVQVILRRRGIAPSYVPPISVVLAARRERYIEGLTLYREDKLDEWIEQFAASAARAAELAKGYLAAVERLAGKWRAKLEAGAAPRADAAAWAIIDVLPAHPVISAPVAAAATGRAKAAIHQGIEELVAAGVLEPISAAKRNRAWEAVGLLELVERMEEGRAVG